MEMYGDQEGNPLSAIGFDLAALPPAPGVGGRPPICGLTVGPTNHRGSARTAKRKFEVAFLMLLLVTVLGEFFFVRVVKVISKLSGIEF